MMRGTTYRRRDGRWECRVSLGSESGQRKYRSFYGVSREQAESKMTAAFRDVSIVITEMTVSEIAAKWLRSVEHRIKASTAANYRMKLKKHIIPSLGDSSIGGLNADDVYAFIDQKLNEELSPRYVADIIVLLKSLCRYANREYGVQNGIDEIVMPKKSKPEIKTMSRDEQRRLVEYIGKERSLSTLGVAAALFMGLRIGELCALCWQDIDLEKRILTVSHTIQRIQCFDGSSKTKLIITEPKSLASRRHIPIPDCIVPLLEEFKNNDDVYVLSGRTAPIEPRTMQYRFKRILRNANLPSYTFHSLRHAFACGAVELGFDAKVLSEILGHSSVRVTLDYYVHSSLEHKRACMNRLTAAF